MPLAARRPCWGDLGRYEANSYGLPTLSEYPEGLQAGLSKNALGLATEQMCPRALPGGAVGHELVVYGL